MAPLNAETRAILARVMQASMVLSFAEEAGFTPTLAEVEAAERALADLRLRCGYPTRETPDWSPELEVAARASDAQLAGFHVATPDDFDTQPPVWMR